MNISVIIPTLNEEEVIGGTLKHLIGRDLTAGEQRSKDLKQSPAIEIIVTDGGSTDNTVEACKSYVRVINSEAGRGIQMNAGAKEASGEILLFLHADTLPPENWKEKIISVMSDEMIVGGAFSLSIASGSLPHRFIAAAANMRSRITGIPYGDQGIFVRRSAFERVGGFKEIQIMEDVDLVRRLKKAGKVVMLKDKVKTSARRWEKEGVVYTTLRNWLLVGLYYTGVPPERLYRFYKMIR